MRREATLVLLFLLGAAAPACRDRTASAPVASGAPAPGSADAGPAGPSPESAAPPWIDDDYPGALARARAAGVPLLIDFWAPWCHTCLSMRSFVLPDPSLAPAHRRFVWLALNTELEANAPLRARFPISALPTFLILDPATEAPQGTWVGSASTAQLAVFLDDGERAVRAAHGGALPPADPLALVLEADRRAAARQPAEAARLYGEALAAAPPGWARRPDVLVARAGALGATGDARACVTFGLAEIEATGPSASASDFAYLVLACAADLPAGDAAATELRRAAERRLTALTADDAAPLSADDRGDALGILAETRDALGDAAGARAARARRLAVLEAAAAAAPDAARAATFNWARAETLLALDRGAEAVRLLEASERALPGDYNPPHHLGRVHARLGHTAEAVAALDRALRLAYGPRQAAIAGFKADVLEKAGRLAEARAAVEAQLGVLGALPDGQRKPGQLEAARERLARLKPR